MRTKNTIVMDAIRLGELFLNIYIVSQGIAVPTPEYDTVATLAASFQSGRQLSTARSSNQALVTMLEEP